MIPPLTQRLRDGWMDPLRRRNSVARIVEGMVGGAASITSFVILPFPWALVALGIGVLAEFVVYEFVLEPLGWIGPYWERGPRDGETFTRG